MYRATREFITARQPFAKMEIQVVTVKQLGGGMANNCSDNAINNAENMDEVLSVTGWLVHPFNPLTNTTEIIQHWWNVDKNRNYFDTSPDVLGVKCDYVLDFDLYRYAFDNYDDIESIVACSLLLKDGAYIAALADLKDIQNVRYKPINSLDTKTLFTFF
jgi:hypothetical protein